MLMVEPGQPLSTPLTSYTPIFLMDLSYAEHRGLECDFVIITKVPPCHSTTETRPWTEPELC